MESELKKRQGQQFKLRIPDDLYEWVKKTAQENDRPMAYIVNRAIKQLKKEQEI
ncbi:MULTISPECIES: Arc family DNA-binding protein [Acinetobacter]|uniref:Arc family DNA-binding protein n=1 Tax=Acinetobacter TaxID=469 RepID=UPI0002CE81D9|nr:MULTISPECIES: Arc family DNA-binding protein [Acinetobacter]ENV53907.1 hypothetical protein F952_01960 [Acinetobacter baylyi DSM 14961 = CIP 107474]MAK31422.1 Arc family DNA-binding protein [Acinetobacter sp.]UXJ55986.1 Arc family DNA-binding protein [Acinetobacter baylyi]UXJ59446.1 Arc family DNA-binding protein [Acinetobacter baylyi]